MIICAPATTRSTGLLLLPSPEGPPPSSHPGLSVCDLQINLCEVFVFLRARGIAVLWKPSSAGPSHEPGAALQSNPPVETSGPLTHGSSVVLVPAHRSEPLTHVSMPQPHTAKMLAASALIMPSLGPHGDRETRANSPEVQYTSAAVGPFSHNPLLVPPSAPVKKFADLF